MLLVQGRQTAVTHTSRIYYKLLVLIVHDTAKTCPLPRRSFHWILSDRRESSIMYECSAADHCLPYLAAFNVVEPFWTFHQYINNGSRHCNFKKLWKQTNTHLRTRYSSYKLLHRTQKARVMQRCVKMAMYSRHAIISTQSGYHHHIQLAITTKRSSRLATGPVIHRALEQT